ncbi:MAG: DUF5681 domain-containing protein [Novosphingobium sp.]
MEGEAGKYPVGYGRPPAKHQFRKGQSGNPGGRPRGAKNRTVDTGLGMRAAEEFLRFEAYRPVTIREGERVMELPAIQAVFRAMGVAAMKGNRCVQKQLAEMVTKAEKQDHQSRMELFGKAIDYKQRWDAEFERCREAGQPQPVPLPHPDDVILDPNTGGVRIHGPQTKEQKAQLDEAIARRTEAQEDVNYFAAKYRRARDVQSKARWLEEWHFEQRMFDIINDILAERYKATLENRSYREGASREGAAIEEMRKNKSLRQEYVGE